MENDKHYFTVGLYIVGIALLLMGFAVWLADSGNADDVPYRIYFRESVSGLTEGGPVKYRGVNVGKVERIKIDEDDTARIQVDVRLLKDTPVKTDTRAKLALAGITGAIYVDLTAGSPEAESLRHATPRGDIPVIPSEESTVAAVINQLPAIMEKLSHFADQMNKLASDQAIADLSRFFTNSSDISTDVRDIVKSTKQDSKQVARNLRKASRDINDVTERVKDNPSALIFPPDEEGISPP